MNIIALKYNKIQNILIDVKWAPNVWNIFNSVKFLILKNIYEYIFKSKYNILYRICFSVYVDILKQMRVAAADLGFMSVNLADHYSSYQN